MAWREEYTRSYDAAGYDRLNDGWLATNQPGVTLDRAHRDILRARARDQERNSDMTKSMICAYVRGVVGRGFILQSKITDANGELDDSANRIVEALWAEWCRPRNCDIQGRWSFAKMCRIAVRRMLVDGGVFFIKSYTPGGVAPLALQMREVDELDTTYTAQKLKSGNYVVDGIEVDRYGRSVGYYFKDSTPDGYTTLDPQRVAADRVIYLQDVTRPTQIREMTPLASGMSRVRDADEYIQSVSVQARVAACFAGIIKKVNPGGSFGRGVAGTRADAQSGYGGQTITPGMLYYLQPGEDVSTLDPPSISSSAKELLSIQQRLAAGGQGLSYEAASRDLSMVNYSSIRQGALDDRDEYGILQDEIIEILVREVYTSFLVSAALVNKLPFGISELLGDKPRYMAHDVIGRGWNWIDPVKEANANKIALETGQDTLANICAMQGRDWRDVIEQRGREIAAMQAAGILTGGGENASTTETAIAQ
jgi:lambda family phage portal protein